MFVLCTFIYIAKLVLSKHQTERQTRLLKAGAILTRVIFVLKNATLRFKILVLFKEVVFKSGLYFSDDRLSTDISGEDSSPE